MTVGELIELLSKFPPDMTVMRSDYEEGPCDIYDVEKASDWYARYEILRASNEPDYVEIK